MAMKTRQYKKGMWNKWVMGAALCGLVLTPAVNALAADEVTVPITAIVESTLQAETTAAMNFGTIPLNPLGDVITLDATTGKTAKPTSEKLVPISGGGPGLITVTAKGPFYVTAAVPANASLDGENPDNSLQVTEIQAKSNHNQKIQAGTSGTSGTYKAEIFLGGVLELTSATAADTYSGEITVSLNYSAT